MVQLPPAPAPHPPPRLCPLPGPCPTANPSPDASSVPALHFSRLTTSVCPSQLAHPSPSSCPLSALTSQWLFHNRTPHPIPSPSANHSTDGITLVASAHLNLRVECSIPGSGRSPAERNGNPLQFMPGESQGQRITLAGYGPWGGKESDMTKTT